MKSPIRIAFLHEGRNVFGAETSVLNCLKSLDRSSFSPCMILMRRGPLLSEAEKTGISILYCPWLDVRGKPWLFIPAVWRFSRLLKKNHIDIIEGYSCLRLMACSAFLAGCRTIYRLRVQGRPISFLVRLFLASCTRIVPVSRGAIAEWEDPQGSGWWGRAMSKRVRVIPVGRDIAELQAAQSDRSALSELGLPDDARIIGVVAALEPDKGQDLLLRAAALVAAQEPNVWLLLVGVDYSMGRDKDYADRLRGLAKELNLQDRVIMTGYRPDAAGLMRHFDVMVLPSRREAIGGVLIEAQALGIPVVASDAGGIPEAVMDGKTGILVRDGDPRTYAEAVLKILRNPEMAARMGREGRKWALEFDNARVTRRLEECYREAVSERPVSCRILGSKSS